MVIDSNNKLFSRTRLRLTGIFAASIFVVLVLFSVGVYFGFAKNLDPNVEYEGTSAKEERALEQKVLAEAGRRLAVILIVVDLSGVVVAAVVGWVLAGNALAPVQSAFRRQRQFVSDAAHELRTPLSVMKAGLETIGAAGKPRADDYEELNKDMLLETNRLADLTNDLLLLAGVDDTAVATREDVDVSAVARRQTRLMQAYARDAGVVLKADIQPEVIIRARTGDIERVVLNLLKNAVDYNRQGGEASLAVSSSGRDVVLEVTDTGIGIAADQLKNVFKRFYKADASRERARGGAGLGLSIVSDLVELHGGRINITSQAGVGTKVTVTFIKS